MIGRNSSGKSSILEALYLALACAQPRDAVRGVDKLDYIVGRRGGRGSWDGSRGLLWHMGEVETPIEIQVGVEGKSYRFVAVDADREKKPVRLVIDDGRLVDLYKGSFSKSVEDVKAGIFSTVGVEGELANIRGFFEKLLLVNEILLRRPEAIESYAWPRILPRRLDKRLTETLREELEPEAEGLTYIPDREQHYMVLQTTKTAVRIDDLGDGTRIALLISMLTLAYRPKVILIEEPENHLHPAGLYTYMRFLTRLAGDRDMCFQIIATTRSIELVQIAEALAREHGIGLSVLYLEREDGFLKPRGFSISDIDALRKLGIDPRLLHRF